MDRRTFIKNSSSAAFAGLMTKTHGLEVRETVDSRKEKPLNFLFIMTDQWRYQAQGYVKQDPVQTPNVDRLAKESFAFQHGIASSPVCSPNRACWLTGRFHQNHGVNRVHENHVKPEQLLSKQFKQSGYDMGYIGKWHLSGKAYPNNTQATPQFLRSDFDYWYRSLYHSHFHLRYENDGEFEDLGYSWQPDHETDKAIE